MNNMYRFISTILNTIITVTVVGACSQQTDNVSHEAASNALPTEGDAVVYAAGDVSGADAEDQGDDQTAKIIVDAADADAVFALGDLQYDNGGYQNFTDLYHASWGQFKDKTYPVVGNHEAVDPDGRFAGYFKYFGEAGSLTERPGEKGKGYYSFDIGSSWHVVALNTNDVNIDAEQKEWLKADLAKTTKRCILAMGHHPRYSAAKYGECSDKGVPLRMTEVFQILADAKVDVYLSGHDHQYQRFAKQDNQGQANDSGVRAFVIGSGGNEHYPMKCGLHGHRPMANLQAENDEDFGVLKLKLRDGAYDWEFIRAGTTGDDADSGTQLGCNAR